jgi:hypothetical protein
MFLQKILKKALQHCMSGMRLQKIHEKTLKPCRVLSLQKI